MQVGETVATVTVGSLAGFLARLRQNGAPDDTAIGLHHHKNGGGWTLSADFEASLTSGWDDPLDDPRRMEMQLAIMREVEDERNGAVPA